MRVFIPLLVVLATYSLFAQNDKLDSLKSVLETDISVDDKVITYTRIADQFQNPNDKLIYARMAYEEARNASDEAKMRASTKMGACMGMLGILDSSEFYFRKTIEIAEEAANSYYISSGYNGLGNIARMKGELEKSIDYFLQAIKSGENVPIENWSADMIANLSGVYYDLGNYEAALEKVQEARAMYLETGDSMNISYSANLLAIVHRALGNLDEALIYNKQALGILLKSKDTVQIIYNYSNTVSILVEQNRLAEAAEYAEKTVLMADEFGEREPFISTMTTLSSIYFRQGELTKAEDYARRALEESRKYDFRNQLHNIYMMQSLIAASSGRYEEAFKLTEERQAINDSVRSSEVSDKVAELNMKYETEKKEAEIERLNEQQEQAKTVNKILIVGAAFVLIALMVIWYFYRQKVRVGMELQGANDAKDRLLSVVAHDIKNPLSAMKGISSLLHEEFDDLSEAQRKEMVAAIDSSSDKLYSLLQNLLDWSISETGGLSYSPENYQLGKISKEAIDLFQSAIAAKKLNVRNEIPDEVQVHADYKMVFSIIRNLLANAISFTPNGGDIFIESKIEYGQVQACVRDTGRGISAERIATLFSKTESSTKGGTGLGLVLCREFVERHGGKIWVESEEGKGASFFFTLPSG